MNNTNNGAVGDKNGKTARRTFSVSKEFSHLIPEIDSLPNSSRFICEAIAEKLERQKNPGKDIADALSQFVQLQSIISNSQPLPLQTPNMNYMAQVEGVSSYPPSAPVQAMQTAQSSPNHEDVTLKETSATLQEEVTKNEETQVQDNLPNNEGNLEEILEDNKEETLAPTNEEENQENNQTTDDTDSTNNETGDSAVSDEELERLNKLKEDARAKFGMKF